jgi:hypothetical protein
MMDRNVDCLCQQLHCGPFPLSRLDRFAAVRMECPAIRELFVPNTIWQGTRIHLYRRLKPDSDHDKTERARQTRPDSSGSQDSAV